MSMISKALYSTFAGCVMGGGGVLVSSLLVAGKMPPRANVLGAAGFMGCVLGVGSFVRGR